mmetsp:Transcript_17030/g.51680  ORF Transcript_17030/g.51680 Transcript_17030/m.51680 type:complete len:591 (-) Transcript_17030:32-1804(-)
MSASMLWLAASVFLLSASVFLLSAICCCIATFCVSAAARSSGVMAPIVAPPSPPIMRPPPWLVNDPRSTTFAGAAGFAGVAATAGGDTVPVGLSPGTPATGSTGSTGAAGALRFHSVPISWVCGRALALGLVAEGAEDALTDLVLDRCALGPGAVSSLLEAVMLRTTHRGRQGLMRLSLDGNALTCPTVVGQLGALIGGPAAPATLSLVSCRLPPVAAHVLAKGIDAQTALVPPRPPATLRVVVERGEGLVVKDWSLRKANRSSDPYVIVKVQGKEIGRTEVVKKSLEPRWDSGTFECKVDDPATTSVELRIWDKDLVGSDAMGAVSLTGEDFLEGEDARVAWRDVERATDCKDASGRLRCGCSWTRPAPPPVAPNQRRRKLETLLLRGNPRLGDRGCAALGAAAARAPALERLSLVGCGCGPATGIAIADELAAAYGVQRPDAWGPGPSIDDAARTHFLSLALAENPGLGGDAIERLALVASRSKYKIGIDVDARGDDSDGHRLAGLPISDCLHLKQGKRADLTAWMALYEPSPEKEVALPPAPSAAPQNLGRALRSVAGFKTHSWADAAGGRDAGLDVDASRSGWDNT